MKGKLFILSENDVKRLRENNFSLVSNNPLKQNIGNSFVSVQTSTSEDGTQEFSEPTTLDKVQGTRSRRNNYNSVYFGSGLGSFGLW